MSFLNVDVHPKDNDETFLSKDNMILDKETNVANFFLAFK